jgi:hypothetical protein
VPSVLPQAQERAQGCMVQVRNAHDIH